TVEALDRREACIAGEQSAASLVFLEKPDALSPRLLSFGRRALLPLQGRAMYGRDVVRFHRVFDINLPVARQVVFLAAHADHVLDSVRREHLGQIAEMMREWRR